MRYGFLGEALGFVGSEGLDRLQHLTNVIGNGNAKAFIFSSVNQMLKQSVNRHFVAPKIHAQKHHQAGVTVSLIMIGNSCLKNFLYRAGAARRVDQAPTGDAKNRVFTNAVIEKFGNVRGKWCCRLVPLKPSGHSQTDEMSLSIFQQNVEGGR